MIDILILAVVGALVGLAGGYVYRSLKAGKTCIGCPENGSCSGNCSGCRGRCGGK